VEDCAKRAVDEARQRGVYVLTGECTGNDSEDALFLGILNANPSFLNEYITGWWNMSFMTSPSYWEE